MNAAVAYHSNMGRKYTIAAAITYSVFSVWMFVVAIYTSASREATRANMICSPANATEWCISPLTAATPIIADVFAESAATTDVGLILLAGNTFTIIPARRLASQLDKSLTTTITTQMGNEVTVADFFCAVHRTTSDSNKGPMCFYTANRLLVTSAIAMLCWLLFLALALCHCLAICSINEEAYQRARRSRGRRNNGDGADDYAPLR